MVQLLLEKKIRALKRNPDDFVARIGLATSYSMGGRVEEARELFGVTS